jgi:sterol desaturase/sphingolipid hydroxylase (fatty acid hydroxylase superfamily)
MGKAIAVATPFFFLLIGLEWLVTRKRGISAYRLNDAVNSLSLGVMSQVVNLFVKALTIGVYAWVYEHVALGAWPRDAWWAWVLAVIFYDFCYYWNHRLGHESAVFWASHVVHHQSQCYNLSTALRQTSTSALASWIFYVPMALAGVRPEMFAVAAIIDLLYQYWIHTELVGKLGVFDRWFASPSNHRVHHAVNDRYIDRNYGGIFMTWDRLFGTFVEETEQCVYGTRAPLESWDPLWANVEVYADLARKSRACARWSDKIRVWWKPPGWQPATAIASWHKPSFDLAAVRTFDPPMTPSVRSFALVQLTAVILGTIPLLWYSSELPAAALVGGAAATLTLLWVVGAVMQGRLRLSLALGAELALLGIVVAATAAVSAPLPTVRGDASVQRAVERARTGYLAQQPFDRMQVTVLLRDRSGAWKHGAVEGDAPAYPASVVKLGFLVAAVHWCHEHERAPDCLDQYVRPMIVESDNVATGFVVDAISGAPNASVDGADVEHWIEQRRYTERVLDAQGLLGPQRLFTKTYPTNSGEDPADLERLAWQRLGRNAMTPDLTAKLMLAIVSGTIEPQATDYMRALLRRPRFSAHSALGGGLPPGSDYENKPGSAFDTLQDVMYARLPSGRELVVSVFSNGWDANEREPWDVARLGDFAQRLLHELHLDARGSASRLLEPRIATDDEMRWRWRNAAAGKYELAVWYDADAANTPRASARVEPLAADAASDVDQTTWGRRWIRLGDFDLPRGTNELVMTRRAAGRLAPTRLRITPWPAQH